MDLSGEISLSVILVPNRWNGQRNWRLTEEEDKAHAKLTFDLFPFSF
jgi:hypothetical protein